MQAGSRRSLPACGNSLQLVSYPKNTAISPERKGRALNADVVWALELSAGVFSTLIAAFMGAKVAFALERRRDAENNGIRMPMACKQQYSCFVGS